MCIEYRKVHSKSLDNMLSIRKQLSCHIDCAQSLDEQVVHLVPDKYSCMYILQY